MKRFAFLFFLFHCFLSFSQTGGRFINYQSIIRDANGNELAAGTFITLNFKFYNNYSITAVAYEEDFQVTIPSHKVVNLKLGKGNYIGGNFSSIDWKGGDVHYLVTLNGTPLGSRIPFATVPYAFSSFDGSSAGYTGSNNVTINSGTLDLSNTGVTPGVYGSNSGTHSKINMIDVDQKGRIINAYEYTANITGDVRGKLDSQIVRGINGVPLAPFSPTLNQILQFNGTQWIPVDIPTVGPPTYSPGYGISIIPGPPAVISVLTNSVNAVWGTQGNSGTNPTLNFIGTTDNTNLKFRVANQEAMVINAGTGHIGINDVSAPSRLTVKSSTVNNPTIFAENTFTALGTSAHGVHGKTSSPINTAAGVFGESTVALGVYGVTSGTAVSGVLGRNLNSASSASMSNGVTGITANSHSLSNGVYGSNSGWGRGVFGINTNSAATNVFGVFGTVSNMADPTNAGVAGVSQGLALGVAGYNSGAGTAVLGLQDATITGTSSHAGVFNITNPNNNASALLGSTSGTGAAVHARSGASNTSALSLLLEQGHIRSIGPAPTVSNTSVSGGFSLPSAITINGTDVKGTVSFTTFGNLSGFAFVDLPIYFAKPYAVPPVVVLTPLTDIQGLSYSVGFVNQFMFTLRLYRSVGSPFPSTVNSTGFVFNYIVIE